MLYKFLMKSLIYKVKKLKSNLYNGKNHTSIMSYHDNYKHSIFYYNRKITTLNEALRILYLVSNPILIYKQAISLQNPYLDISYTEHIHHKLSEHLFYLTFPPHLTAVGNFKNNYNCKMVIYFTDKITNFIREIELNSSTYLNLLDYKNVQMVMYTRGKEDIILSFQAILSKKKLLSKL